MKLFQTEQQQATLATTIADLQTCFSKDEEMILIWLAMAGKEFIDELRRDELMAMLIFLYCGVLPDRLSDD